MSKLIEPSVSDSFNAPRTPPDPNKTNWNQILLQVGLSCFLTFIMLQIANRSCNRRLLKLENDLTSMHNSNGELMKSVQKLTSRMEEKASTALETELNDKV